jgi:thiol-disulfide isomerase/thioredoxin
MKKATVTIFGVYAPPCGDCDTEPNTAACSCSTIDIMRKEAEHLEKLLKQKHGDIIEFAYVDVAGEEFKNYPEIEKVIENYQLPLTVLDGKPLLQGGVSFIKVSEAINTIVNVS